jgi:hypothetical protein
MSGKRIFTRKSGLRDARLIVIAAEGEKTEKVYFLGLKEYYANPRIHVEVLEHVESASEPARILRLLDQFKQNYRLRRDYDELWLVIDVDRWREQKLSIVSQQCFQKGYKLAVSNPSFEIWLLLHIRALDAYSADILAEFLANQKVGNRTRLEQELLNELGHYNKTNLDMNFFCQQVYNAVENAQKADVHPEDRWPNSLGTRVYLLAQEILPE